MNTFRSVSLQFSAIRVNNRRLSDLINEVTHSKTQYQIIQLLLKKNYDILKLSAGLAMLDIRL